MSHQSLVAIGLAAVLAIAAGCSNKGAQRQAKRDEDRRQLQVEDLTNQRNALQSELRRVQESAAAMQANLKTAQQQLDQARLELGRARAELESVKSMAAAAEAQKAELARLKEQLSQLHDRVNASPAPPREQRVVTPSPDATVAPTTQPNLNK
jgi:chromosome segregation ATPase